MKSNVTKSNKTDKKLTFERITVLYLSLRSRCAAEENICPHIVGWLLFHFPGGVVIYRDSGNSKVSLLLQVSVSLLIVFLVETKSIAEKNNRYEGKK